MILVVVKQSKEDNTYLYVELSNDMRVMDQKQAMIEKKQDEFLKRQMDLEKLVKAMAKEWAKDFSDLMKELKFTPY